MIAPKREKESDAGMKTKVMGMFALLIIALSLVGFAYAYWWDNVYIEGTISMGALSLVWDETELLDYTDNEDQFFPIKEVANGSIYYDPESYVVDEHTGKGGYEILVLEVNNAYPNYIIAFNTLTINNTGTIPAHFVDLIITGYDDTDDEDLVFVWEPGFEFEEGAFWNDVDGDGALEDIINVSVVNFESTQLDPCHVTKGEIDLEFKQDAEECHTYLFWVEIVGVQWNKVAEYP